MIHADLSIGLSNASGESSPASFHRRVTRSRRIVRDTPDSTAITADNNGRPDSTNVLLSSHKPDGSGDSDNAGIQYGCVQHGMHALVDDEHDRRDLSGKFDNGTLSPNEPSPSPVPSLLINLRRLTCAAGIDRVVPFYQNRIGIDRQRVSLQKLKLLCHNAISPLCFECTLYTQSLSSLSNAYIHPVLHERERECS